jgi:hypothetical protein
MTLLCFLLQRLRYPVSSMQKGIVFFRGANRNSQTVIEQMQMILTPYQHTLSQQALVKIGGIGGFEEKKVCARAVDCHTF